MTPTEVTAAQDPWARWGWLMGAAWIVFLVFPIGAVIDADATVLWTTAALAAIAGFAVVYVLGFVRMMRDRPPIYGAWASFIILIALTGALALLIGFDAIGMTPFIVSFAMFVFGWYLCAVLAASTLVASLLVLWASGEGDLWFFVILLPAVFGFTLLVRLLDHHGTRHARLQQEMAVVDERERVARDVHDVLGHSLTAISVKAELASRLVDVDPARAAQELTQVQSLAREALTEIRSTVSGLRATRIDDELEVARESLRAAGIDADLPEDPDVVEVSNRIVFAWALREATTNVIRHSGARRCTVELGPTTLVVADDGPRPGDAPEGNGLRGLRERVTGSGGTVTFGPGPGGVGHELKVQM